LGYSKNQPFFEVSKGSVFEIIKNDITCRIALAEMPSKDAATLILIGFLLLLINDIIFFLD
jgi:hypothetical protein